jgi:hypothetical protein
VVKNEGFLDRGLRALLGITLIAMGVFGIVSGLLGTAVEGAGAAAVSIAIVGWCPLLALLHWDTHCTRVLARETHLPTTEETHMTTNLGALDRATRMTVGIMMMALGLSKTVAGTLGIALDVVGTGLLVSGTIGWCMIYRWLKWSSLPKGT